MIREVPIPAGSDIARHTPGAYFADAFSTPFTATDTPALQIYLDRIGDMPPLVSGLMRLRNLLWSPPFIMYYLTFLLPGVRTLLQRHGLEAEVHDLELAGPWENLRLVIATRTV